MDHPQQIMQRLQNIAAQLARESDQILQTELGIGFSQYKILSVLQNNQRLQQRAIALELGQTEASISRQIKFLEKKGLLTVRQNPTNRRVHVSELTTKGVQVARAGHQALLNYHRTLTGRLSPRQQEVLLELLTELYA